MVINVEGKDGSEMKTKILSFYDYHFMTKHVSLR